MLIDVINEANEVINQVTREEVYRDKLRHRIIHIFLVKENKVFIQQRSNQVEYLPGYFCTSAGGHVEAGESPLEAASRELKEELGIEGPLTLLDEFIYNGDEHERRIFLYKVSSLKAPNFIDGEVSGGGYYSREEIDNLSKEKFHPQLLPCLERYFSKEQVNDRQSNNCAKSL